MNKRKDNRGIEEVLEANSERLLAKPGVVGVGIGEQAGSPAILIMLKESTPEVTARLPRNIEGYPVRIDVTGEVTAF